MADEIVNGATQLFPDLDTFTGGRGLVAVSYLDRALKSLADPIKKLHLTMEGGNLTYDPATGHLHIKVTGGAGSGDHPFKVSISGGTISVAPGYVFSNNFASESNPLISFVPWIGSKALDANEPPTLTVAAGWTGYVALRMVFSKDDGSPVRPWRIFATQALRNTQLQRVMGDVEGVDSSVDLPLARIVSGALRTQAITGSIYVTTSWNTIVMGAV